VGLHFETDLFAPLFELFSTSTGPLLAIRVRVIRDPVLGLVWLDGRMEDVRSVLDLEVEGVELLGDLVNGAKNVLLPNEAERTILWEVKGSKRAAQRRKDVGRSPDRR
jgi:hypothetical protein